MKERKQKVLGVGSGRNVPRAQPFEEPSPSLSKCSGPQWEYPEARTVFCYAHGAEARAN